jgi:hypothetical protein
VNLLGTRYTCPACAAQAQLSAEAQFKCPHCDAELQANPNLAFFVAILFGGMPSVFGSAFGDLGNAIGTVASLAFMFFLWRVLLKVRRRDAV